MGHLVQAGAWWWSGQLCEQLSAGAGQEVTPQLEGTLPGLQEGNISQLSFPSPGTSELLVWNWAEADLAPKHLLQLQGWGK